MTDRTPPAYEPFPEVWLCGSSLRKVRFWFELDGQLPLLIGRGPAEPLVWLRGPERPNAPSDWQDLVTASVPSSLFSVHHTEHGSCVLRGEYQVVEFRIGQSGVLIVSTLDLRPIGLNIYGTVAGLVVGSHRFEKNQFSNVGTMIGIGKSPQSVKPRTEPVG